MRFGNVSLLNTSRIIFTKDDRAGFGVGLR